MRQAAPDAPLTSASEVEQFAYCPHNWWLARQGVDGNNAATHQGSIDHRALGTAQDGVERLKREARRAWLWAGRILFIAVSGTLLTLEAVYLRQFEHQLILIALTSVLAAGTIALALLADINRRRYRRDQVQAGLVPGRLVATDLGGQGPLLHDKDWDLSGRPDYVLHTQSGFVPVEVKTGKTPAHPHRNHKLQLACYLRLIEVETARRPEYGLINYPDGVFRVGWDAPLQQDLQATLQAIAKARAEGKADRDHQHKGRCLGCSRRDACTQKLA